MTYVFGPYDGLMPGEEGFEEMLMALHYWPHKPLALAGDEQFGYFLLPADWTVTEEDGRSVYSGDGVTLRFSTIAKSDWDGDLKAFFTNLRDSTENHGSETGSRSLGEYSAMSLLLYPDYEKDICYLGFADDEGELQLLVFEGNLDAMEEVAKSSGRGTKDLRDLIIRSYRREP